LGSQLFSFFFLFPLFFVAVDYSNQHTSMQSSPGDKLA